jgi:hypothetical protein
MTTKQTTPALCCPVIPVRGTNPGNYATSNQTTVTPGLDCSNPTAVSICEKDVVLDGMDCNGDLVEVSGKSDSLKHVVQVPGTVFTVKMCQEQSALDAEIVVRCDPTTGDEILLQWNVLTNPPTLVSATNLVTNSPYTGDLKALTLCADQTQDYDSTSQVMCDAGKTFMRWFATKDGQPIGIKWDTLIDGTSYTVSDEAKVTVGICTTANVCAPTISSVQASDLTGLLPGRVIGVQNPTGLDITVVTSAGSFMVAKGMVGFATSDFVCPVTVERVIAVSGSLSDVIITTQNW